MMDNPDIYLDICRDCCGTGEVGLGFYQECPVCSGIGSASPPSDDTLRQLFAEKKEKGRFD